MPPLAELAKDLAWQTAVVSAGVELIKDLFQRAPAPVIRAATYGLAFLIVALATWDPATPWNAFVVTVLFQGGAAASAAWAAHAAVKTVVPTLPPIAAATALIKAEPAAVQRLRSRDQLEAEGRAKEEAARFIAAAEAEAAEIARVTAVVRQVMADARAPAPAPVPSPPVDTPAPEAEPVITRVPRERDLPGGT